MSTINKVPASAGAEWLLGGFALLRKAPVGLGMLVVYWTLASNLLVGLAAMTGSLTLIFAAQFIVGLAGPLFLAAMVWAVREVEAGRPVSVRHLLQPVRDGRGPALLATLLPQVVLAVVMVVLLFAMIGSQQIEHLADVYQKLQAIAAAGGKPDPALMQDLPAGRLLLWLLLVIVAFIAAAWMTFIATPQILFQGSDAWSAMRTSLRACVHNWPAMLLFYLLAGVAFFGIAMILLVFATLLQLLTGPGIAVALWQLALFTITMPTLAGAMLVAWRQMLFVGNVQNGSASAAAPTHHIEV